MRIRPLYQFIDIDHPNDSVSSTGFEPLARNIAASFAFLGSESTAITSVQEEMEAVQRLEEQKAREEAERKRKLEEAAEKQRRRDAELEEKARKEKEEAAARPPAPAGGGFVPSALRVRPDGQTAAAPVRSLPRCDCNSIMLCLSQLECQTSHSWLPGPLWQADADLHCFVLGMILFELKAFLVRKVTPFTGCLPWCRG